MAETSKRFNTIELEQKRRMLQNWDEDHTINPKNFSKNVLLKKNTLNIRSLKTTEIKFNKLFKDKEQQNNIEEKNETEKEIKKKGKKMKKGKKANSKAKKGKLILKTENIKTPQIKRANTSLNDNLTSLLEKDKELIDISVNNKETQLTTNPQNI